jgi:PAS domain-containing protein
MEIIMSFLRRLFACKSSEIALRKGIQDSKESLLRLEIMTNEIDCKEEKIRSHEKLLQIAFEEIEMPAWSKDIDGRFVFMNLACAEKILHTTIENGLAMTDKDFENDALAGVCMTSDKIVLDTRKTRRQIEHARYGDGSDVWLDTTKSPWVISDEVIGTVGFGRIITDIVPEDIREKYKESGFINIEIDLMYNSEDIGSLIENG